MLLQTRLQKQLELVVNPESTISRNPFSVLISYIWGGVHQILAPDLTHLPCEQDRALISRGKETW